MKKLAGVDDAGRGCVIGPLIIAGILVYKEKIIELENIGVRDSKKISSKKREKLALEIERIVSKSVYFEITPKAIDLVVERKKKLRKLNYLEAMAMAKLIRDLKPDMVYVDPSDVIPERFAKQILRVLPEKPDIICEHHADDKYSLVSAASIIAKVRRDNIIEELKYKHGDFGSGYCHDQKTIHFLEEWFREKDHCPNFVRCSWSTVKRILENRKI